MKGYTYILKCSDESFYTGSTTDIKRRFSQHQKGLGANHTKKRLPVVLVYVEEYETIQEAYKHEKQIQGWSRKKKQALIDGDMNKLHILSKCQNDSHYSHADTNDTEQHSNNIKKSDWYRTTLDSHYKCRTFSDQDRKKFIDQGRNVFVERSRNEGVQSNNSLSVYPERSSRAKSRESRGEAECSLIRTELSSLIVGAETGSLSGFEMSSLSGVETKEYKTKSYTQQYLTLLFLMLIIVLPISYTHAQSPKEAMQKMVEYYNENKKIAAIYHTTTYAEDLSETSHESMKVWLENEQLYYKYQNTEYIQIEGGSIMLEHDEKIARYTPSVGNQSGIDRKAIIDQQLAIIEKNSDTIVYEGLSNNGRKKYVIKPNYGGYEKVEFWLNDDYSIYKTLYYYRNKAYGSKSELTFEELPREEIEKIEQIVNDFVDAVINNTVKADYKEYEFIEYDNE